MLPEHHKERIVLLTTAKTSTEELKKARPLAASALLRWRGRVRPPITRDSRGVHARGAILRTSKTEDEGGRRLFLARRLCDGASALSVISQSFNSVLVNRELKLHLLAGQLLYTVLNVSTLYSTLAASFGSRYTLMIFEPSSR